MGGSVRERLGGRLVSVVAVVAVLALSSPVEGERTGRDAPATTTRAPAPAPVLVRVERTPEGYALIGSGFGTDAGALKIFEGSREVPRSAIVSVAPDRVVVRSRPAGMIPHRVVRLGRSSAALVLDHGSVGMGGTHGATAVEAPLVPPPSGGVTKQIQMRGTRPLAIGSAHPGSAPATGGGVLPPPAMSAGPTTEGPITTVPAPGASGVGGTPGPDTALAKAAPAAFPPNLTTTPTIQMRGSRPLAIGDAGAPAVTSGSAPIVPPGTSGGLSAQGPGTRVPGPGASSGTQGPDVATGTAELSSFPSLTTTPTIQMRGSRPLSAPSGSPGGVKAIPPPAGEGRN